MTQKNRDLDYVDSKILGDTYTDSSDENENQKPLEEEVIDLLPVSKEYTIETLPKLSDTNAAKKTPARQYTIKLPDDDFHPIEYTYPQKLLQAAYRVVINGAPAFFVPQFLPPIPKEFEGFFAMTLFATNDVVNGIIHNVVEKEDFLSDLRAKGGGEVLPGALKVFTNKVAALSTLTFVSYVTFELLKYNLEVMVNSPHQESLREFKEVITNETFRVSILGLAGLLCYEGVYFIGMNLWNQCIPSKREELKVDPERNILQYFGQYLITRPFVDIAITETLLAHYRAIALKSMDPSAKIIALLLTDFLTEMVRNLAYKLNPIKSALRVQNEEEEKLEKSMNYLSETDSQTDLNQEGAIQESEKVTWCQKFAMKGCIALMRTLAFYGGAYAVYNVVYDIDKSLQSDVFSNDESVYNRLQQYATVLGPPLIFEFGIDVMPKIKAGAQSVKSKMCNFWSSMFRPKLQDNYPLEEQRDDKVYRPVKFDM